MDTFQPGQTIVITESGLPTGVVVGFQVVKAGSNTVAITRTTTGVIERPAGTGNYVFNFIAPPEGDVYLLVIDWSDGVLAPETSRVRELQVTTQVEPGASGLGAIADYVKMRLGGETWKGLTTDATYGASFVARAIDIVKARVFKVPPATADEGTLSALVLDYLGICAALELIPAAFDYWGNQLLSLTTGNDPTEQSTWPNRMEMVKDIQSDLMARLPQAQQLAIPLIDNLVVLNNTLGPDIDEPDDMQRVTADPRDMPNVLGFPAIPGRRRGPFGPDTIGYPPPRTSGVRL